MPTIVLVGLTVFVTFCLLVTSEAHAHNVFGNFSARQPDYFLMLITISAASFGILAVLVKRVGFVPGVWLLTSSLVVLVVSYLIGANSTIYLDVVTYAFGASLVGFVGGIVLTGYHFFAVRPYLKYKVTK